MAFLNRIKGIFQSDWIDEFADTDDLDSFNPSHPESPSPAHLQDETFRLVDSGDLNSGANRLSELLTPIKVQEMSSPGKPRYSPEPPPRETPPSAAAQPTSAESSPSGPATVSDDSPEPPASEEEHPFAFIPREAVSNLEDQMAAIRDEPPAETEDEPTGAGDRAAESPPADPPEDLKESIDLEFSKIFDEVSNLEDFGAGEDPQRQPADSPATESEREASEEPVSWQDPDAENLAEAPFDEEFIEDLDEDSPFAEVGRDFSEDEELHQQTPPEPETEETPLPSLEEDFASISDRINDWLSGQLQEEEESEGEEILKRLSGLSFDKEPSPTEESPVSGAEETGPAGAEEESPATLPAEDPIPSGDSADGDFSDEQDQSSWEVLPAEESSSSPRTSAEKSSGEDGDAPPHLAILERGIKFWNQWRREHPDLAPNLAGADLSGRNLSMALLQKANLRSADLRGTNLWNADLSGANLRGATLQDADLSEANLERADLEGANLRGAELSTIIFHPANLCGANLSQADLSSANLSGANLAEADLHQATLRGANFTEADLRQANLRETDLHEVDLQGALR